jgi:DNA-binding NtrC family response regulator
MEGGEKMTKANKDIRAKLRNTRVTIWRVAEVLGIHESTLIRRMRKEFPHRDKEEIFKIIDQLKMEDAGEELKIG